MSEDQRTLFAAIIYEHVTVERQDLTDDGRLVQVNVFHGIDEAADAILASLPQARAVGDEEVGRAINAYERELRFWNDIEGAALGNKMLAMRAALATRPAAPGWRGMDETGWLIERGGQWYAAAPHTDWTIKQAVADLNRENWTHDADEALRFARKVDAETLIRFVGWQHAEATEHRWVSRALPSPPSPSEEVG